MDDKRLDELLHEMKDDYEKLPEYVDKRSVMNSIRNRKRKIGWGKIIPTFGIVVGLLLFMLISLPYVNDFDQAENDTNYLEMYYLKAKEEFRELLGIESVDSFNLIEQAEIILEQNGSTTDPEEIEQAKAWIDDLFTTPGQIINEINKENKAMNEKALDELLNNMNDLRFNFQEYFRDLLVDHEINIEKQKHILNAQGQPENYTGPIEIADFLIMIKEQGYLISGSNDGRNSLSVQMDYDWLKDGIENWEGHEGFRDYLRLLGSRVDSYMPGVGNRHDIPWTEFDKILLELETLLDAYPEEHKFLINYTGIYYIMTKYLNDYLAGGMDTYKNPAGGNQLDETAQQELKSFVKNYEDSRFHSIVKDAVNIYESHTDWERVRGAFNEGGGELSILFDERFQEISYENIMLINRWPISHSTFGQYHNYLEEKNESFLERLGEFETLSLYMYAHDNQDAVLYGALYSKESEWGEEDKEKLIRSSEQDELDFYWREIMNESSHLIKEEREKENTINYIFIDNLASPAEITASIRMVKEDGGWKVLDRTIE